MPKLLLLFLLLFFMGCGAKSTEMTEDPNNPVVGPDGWTKLHQLAEDGDEIGMRKVLSMDVDANTKAGSKQHRFATPMHVAARTGHLDCMKLLAERGGDISLRLSTDALPLHLAIERCDKEMVAWLIDHDSPLNSDSFFVEKPLELAKQKNCPEVLALVQAAVDKAKK